MSLIKLASSFEFVKQKNPIKKAVQKAALSTFANAVNDIRKGRTSKVDFLKSFESAYKTPGLKGKMVRTVIDQSISQEGKYNIPKVEKWLKFGNKINKIYSTLDKPSTKTYALTGALTGGLTNVALNYKASKDSEKPKRKLIESGLKGAAVGLGSGIGIKRGVNWVAKKTGLLSQLHNTYFKDDYWKKQLEGSNKSIYNKIGKFSSKNFFTTDKVTNG